MKFKQTARKYCTGLPRATFKKSLKKWRSAAKETLKVKIGQYCKNQIPSDSEEAPGDWTDLTPSLPSSPEVADFVDKLNHENDLAVRTPTGTPPPELLIGETLALLDILPPQEPPVASPRPLPILHTPPRSSFEEGMTEDLLMPNPPVGDGQSMEEAVSSTTGGHPEEVSQEMSTPEPQVPQVLAETISTSGTPPPSTRPRFPAAATKCPRKEFRGKAQRVVKSKEPCRKPKCLTVLQEIRKLQTSFEDIIPFAPFARLVRELCSELIQMRFTKEAIQALRSSAEAYLLEIFEKGNLTCRHAGHCTLQPKEMRFVRRVLDHDTSMGSSEESIQAWKLDVLKDRAKQITLKEAQSKEACRRKKLCELARLRCEAYKCQAQRRN